MRAVIDVRTKLFLILFSAVAMFAFFSDILEIGLVLFIFILQLLLGNTKASLRLVITYFVFYGIEIFLLPYLSGVLLMLVGTFVILFRRLFPCMLAGILLLTTTTVSEMMAGLQRLHIPRVIIIPLAVTLRYIPAVREEWGSLRDAMKMRNFAARKQSLVEKITERIECIYVPMLISAAQISEDLSAAAVTRGIENPGKHTVLHKNSFGVLDVLTLAVTIGIVVLAGGGINS